MASPIYSKEPVHRLNDDSDIPRKELGIQQNDDVDDISINKGDLLAQEHVDPVMNAKMHLVNNAIDEIGFTPYHAKLFCLNGFGYAVDSLILLVQSVIATQAAYEFDPTFTSGMTIAVYVGMFVGAIWWGLSADVIGRKFAFNCSLFICSIFAIVAGAAPNWIVLGLFVCLSAFGAGGNLVLDTAVFLEYLPSSKQWLITTMAAWWGAGQLITGLFAWAFLPNFSCASAATCTYENNKGWRYVWFASGALVFVMSVLRITVIRLKETPKYLLGRGKDEEIVETLQYLAHRYNRPCSLTLEKFKQCEQINRRASVPAHASSRNPVAEVMVHLRGLFATKRIGISTCMIWFSWLLIGLAYPLYNVFLPAYLRSRGAKFGEDSAYINWRNYAISNVCSIPGPILAGWMCSTRLGRKYTMVIGALITMAFFFAYTQVRNNAENLAFNCLIGFFLNVYYGTLYAYTPEVLPSAHRGTGNGIAISCNRIMGIMSALVAYYANTNTPVPIWICAALFAVLALISAAFPFEPYGKRSS